MPDCYFDENRTKKTRSAANYAKAREFVKSKEAEIADLKDRLIEACAEMDSEAYVGLMKQISEKERELTTLKEIANRTAEMIAINQL